MSTIAEGPSLADAVPLVRTAGALAEVAARAARAPRIAVDVEANGLFAFRPALCTLQLAWPEEAGLEIVVVDTLAIGVGPLAGLFGPEGPVKGLHDSTFDARLLTEAGAPLARVRDTSVAARLLGFTATGLLALVGGELGVAIDKRFQQHDWSLRPLAPAHLEYLAADVRHLLALDERLAAKADALDIADEIADECAYKLASADHPPRDRRPSYVRIKGAAALDPRGRAALRRLVRARDEAAAAADVPPFKVVSNEVLLALARKKPATLAALAAVPGAAAGRAGPLGAAWLRAIALGLADGDIPEDERALFEPVRVDRAVIAERRAREAQVTSFRRAEAKHRGVDEQAVLPGHCAQDLVELFLAHEPEDPALPAAIAGIPGLGPKRLERYGAAFLALARDRPTAPAPKEQAG